MCSLSPTVTALLSREPLSRKEEAALTLRIQNGDADARWALALANSRFAWTMARQAQRKGDDLEILFSEALHALFSCAKMFDPSKGKFITYAKSEVLRRLDMHVAEFRGAYRLPYYAEKLRRKASTLSAADGFSELDTDDLAERMACSRATANAIKTVLRGHTYLDAGFSDNGEGEGRAIGNIIADEFASTPTESAEKQESHEALRSLLDTLDKRTRQVLTWRFGLDGNPPRTLEEIGQSCHITRERVRQIEFLALRRLRSESRRRAVKETFIILEARENLQRLKTAA